MISEEEERSRSVCRFSICLLKVLGRGGWAGNDLSFSSGPPLGPGRFPCWLLQAEQPQPVSVGEMLQNPDFLRGSPLDSLQKVHSPILGAPELNAGLQNS